MKFKRIVTAMILILFIALSAAGCSKGDKNIQPSQSDTGQKTPASGQTPSKNDQESSRQKEAARLLQEIEKSAREGKVPGCEYAVKSSVADDVEKAWGKPDKNEYIAAAKGTFATYTSRGIVIGSNKGMQIFDIRSYNDDIKVIRASDLAKIYGQADKTLSYDGQQMIGYQMGAEFRLRFIFPAATKSNPNPSLDHLSVLYPAGSVNSMADDPGIEW